MAAVPLEIEAEVEADGGGPDEVSTVRGQVAVALTTGRVRSIALDPPTLRLPPPPSRPFTTRTGSSWEPGSWFTSVMPHLMVPAKRPSTTLLPVD